MKKTIAIVLIVFALAAGLFVYSEFFMVRDMVETVEMVETTEVTPPPADTAKVTEVTEAAEAVEADELSEDGEEAMAPVLLYGEITEITDEYVMLSSAELGQIQVNVSEDTVIEGVEALALGQVVQVTYDGKMTRSLPAQVFGLKIGVYMVAGEVAEITEEGVLVKGENGDVLLTLPESAPELAVGQAITAYTTGVSTLSIPPMMNAVSVK